MALLRELSDSQPVSQKFLEGFEAGCPIIRDDAQFYLRGGDQDRLEEDQDATAADLVTRALYSSPTAEDYTPTYAEIIKYIVTGKVRTDPVVEQRHGELANLTAIEDRTYKKGKMRGRRVQELFVLGDNSAVSTDFDGFDNQVTAAKTLVGDDGGVILPLGGDDVKLQQMQAMERIQTVCRKIRAALGSSQMVKLYANGVLLSRIAAVAHALNYYKEINQLGDKVENLFGFVELRDIGVDTSGNDLLPFGEAYNGGNSASIYLVGWGVREGVTCPTSAGLVGHSTTDEDNNLINKFDLDMGMGVQNENCLWKITGWKLG